MGGESLDVGAHLVVDEIDAGTHLHGQHIAQQAQQVDQGPVELVANRAGAPGLLPSLEVAGRRGGGAPHPGGHRARRALAVGTHQLGELRGVLDVGEPGGIGRGGVEQVLRRHEAAGQVPQAQRDHQDLPTASPHLLVARQGAGPADVALGGTGGEPGQRWVDSLPGDQGVGDLAGCRGTQPHLPGAGRDRGQDVLDRRGTQHPDRPRAGLLQGLEQRVARHVVEPVGVLHDQHVPAALDRRHGRPSDELQGLLGRDLQLLGSELLHIGVAPCQHLAAGRAGAAAPGRALQRRGEHPGRRGAAGPGRAGQQPGVGHRRPRFPASDRGSVHGGRLQPAHGHGLADDGPPQSRLRT